MKTVSTIPNVKLRRGPVESKLKSPSPCACRKT